MLLSFRPELKTNGTTIIIKIIPEFIKIDHLFIQYLSLQMVISVICGENNTHLKSVARVKNNVIAGVNKFFIFRRKHLYNYCYIHIQVYFIIMVKCKMLKHMMNETIVGILVTAYGKSTQIFVKLFMAGSLKK